MKKLFNNRMMRVMIALGMFAMVGCQEYSIDSQPEAAANIQDDALESYVMAAESATSIVFNISANTPWRIDRDENAQWCTVTPSMSATSSLVAEVTVTVEDNDTFSPRQATLTITAAEIEGWSKTITINQMSKGDFLITEWAEDIEAEGGVATYFIYTNKAWEYRPVTSYLSVDTDYDVAGEDVDDIVTYELRINVPANAGMARDARFMIHTATADYEYSIHQIGMELRLADAQNTTFESYAAGDELTFAVKANVSWDAAVDESCADWLEITKVDKEANTVTVVTKGDFNPYATYRVGIVNLIAADLDPVPVKVYQNSMFVNNWLVDRDTMYSVDNEDETVTFYPVGSTGTTERLAMRSSIKMSMGQIWVIEFDAERTNIDNSHLYFHISPDGTVSQSNGISRAALTPNIPSALDNINNNCFVHNGGTWTGNVNRWNIDGVGGGIVPEELITSEDVKKLERVSFEMTELGVKMTVVANGKEFSYTRLLSDTAEANREKFTTAYKTVEVYAAFGFFNSDYEDEYATVTKCYITSAE